MNAFRDSGLVKIANRFNFVMAMFTLRNLQKFEDLVNATDLYAP